MVDRNAPCQCGSGKKYKRCCEKVIPLTTRFVHEMRGEILVHLEKPDFFARENGLRVLGRSNKRAQELDPSLLEQIPYWFSVEMKEQGERLPDLITHQLDNFCKNQVRHMQKETQQFYHYSLDLLTTYLEMRFGRSFNWSLANEEVFLHFLKVWYLDHTSASPHGARIFLNTLKHLFRWLQAEGYTDAYIPFRNVYMLLVRSLPFAIEMRIWMKKVANSYRDRLQHGNLLYLLAVSASGPVLWIEGRWVPVQLKGFHVNWADHRFCVRGVCELKNNCAHFTYVEAIYPAVLGE